MALVVVMALAAVGMEEAVIRAALGGMALAWVGIMLALAGTAVAVTGTAVNRMVGVVVGPAIGLGVGLGLLGGALAAAPYYGGYDYSYDYAPTGPPGPTVWYWCDTYQGYYPAIPECPVPWREVVQ
jgi:hypothetical protein